MSLTPHPTITRLQVRNYRSLGEVDVSLTPLTVLVGPNGSGKSNLIDVLRFVRDAITYGLDQAILERNGMSAIRLWSAKGRPYDVHVHLHLEGPDWSGEYGFTLGSQRRGEYQVKWEKASVVESKTRDGKSQVRSTLEIKKGEWVQMPGEMKGLPREMRSISKTTLMLPQVFFTLPFQRMHRFLRDMGFYVIYPNALQLPQNPANPYPLDEEGKNLASILRYLKKEKKPEVQEMLTALSKVVGDVSDYSVQQVGGYLVTRLHHTPPQDVDRTPTFPLAQESDGTLRMLGILTALYQTPPRSLLTIEEPELTIHPGALRVLCDVLQEASLRSQVLVTTHSPELVSHFQADLLRVVEKEKGVTQVGPVKESQRKAIVDKLFSPGELMVMEGLQREIGHSAGRG